MKSTRLLVDGRGHSTADLDIPLDHLYFIGIVLVVILGLDLLLEANILGLFLLGCTCVRA